MAENVVKLPAEGRSAKRRLDLRGNNRFKDLLETHALQTAIIHEAMRLKKEADEEIKQILGDAQQARADGYWVTFSEYIRPAHTVKEAVIRTLRITRSGR